MDLDKHITLFSHKRLQSYENLAQHRDNFLLIQNLCAKIGLLEIITRNKVAQILQINDDDFVAKQTLGFWCDTINEHKIHNALVNLNSLDFKKYSRFNRKDKMRNYQKVIVAYALFRTMRNRAFHFENLYKRNANGTPRLSDTRIFGRIKVVVGIEPSKMEMFLDDMIKAFDSELVGYFS